MHPPGAAVLLQSLGGRGFLLLQKIDHRPKSLYHGKYSWFGGRAKRGENSYQVLERELREEWRDQELVTEILRAAIMQPPLELPAREWGGMYKFHPYIATANYTEMERWIGTLQMEGAVREGRAVFLSRQELMTELEFPEKFLAGLETPIYNHLMRLS